MANSNQRMHFKHPEVLYFLFLLIVPIIVHLFQFRRFQKEYFTNVRFLKEISIQSRKSSTIKKWLLLFTRMLLLVFLILAFAQPYFEAKDTQGKDNELVVILDNSYSMEAPGEVGSLLQRAIQDIVAEIPSEQKISVLTNDAYYWQTNLKAIDNELLQTSYSTQDFQLQHHLDQVALRFPEGGADVLVITDPGGLKNISIKDSVTVKPFLVQPKHILEFNASVDSVYIAKSDGNFYDLRISVSGYGTAPNPVALSVYNQGKPIAKTSVDFTANKSEVQVSIPQELFHGHVQIEDGGLTYDNRYYFSIPPKSLTNVMVVGETDTSEFLHRIYTSDEFKLNQYTQENLPYGEIPNQDVIVVNEPENVSVALQNSLIDFYKKGGIVVLIPSSELDLITLNKLAQSMGGFRFESFQNKEELVTQINFENPLFNGVFEKKVSNFQYPKVGGKFVCKGIGKKVLYFADNSPFLMSNTSEVGRFYVFSSPISLPKSNFKQSPLIVPVFYKMAVEKQSKVVALSIGSNETFEMEAQLPEDQVLEIVGTQERFIPAQKIGGDKVKMEFSNNLIAPGNYSIQSQQKEIGVLSFNIKRTESSIQETTNLPENQFTQVDSLEEVVSFFQQNREDNEIWRWLLFLTLVFLVFEILIQKLFK